MDKDKDGARWRLWCRAVSDPNSEVSYALEKRFDLISAESGPVAVAAAMTAALDEVLELYPEE